MPNYAIPWLVQSYRLVLWSGTSGSIKAIIVLDGTGGYNALVLFLAGGAMPANYVNQNGSLVMHCTFDQFAPAMEMLREEKPIWVNELLFGWTSLYAGPEPPGEEEGLGG
jgi:hypothetical protein